MSFVNNGAESIFADLCRQRQSEVDKALVEAAETGFQVPIIFRRVNYSTCAGLFKCGTWLPVEVQPDPANKHVYVLPPVMANWIPSNAEVPYIIKLERLDRDVRNNELLKIAPFMADEQGIDDEMVKILVTASTLVEGGDPEKQPVSAYKHDNLVLNIERSFFQKEDSWKAGCLNANVFRWLTGRQAGGYIKI